MAKIMFFPIGNADSTLIHLNDGRVLLIDYCNKPIEENDTRVNLEEEVSRSLRNQNHDFIDLVAFTHADDDHNHGAENIFWLKYDQKYQGDKRIKIKTLAIPANFLLEKGLEGTAKVIQNEAKYRMKEGKDILVIGNPDSLDDWLTEVGIKPETRISQIITAGTCIPGFDINNGNVELFAHSPFSFMMEGEDIPRNNNCLVIHATFFEGNQKQRLMLGSDIGWEDWLNIIYITLKMGNDDRLDWDIFHISHHCSYTALSDEKGDEITTPKPEIKQLFNQGSNNCFIISPSDPIPDMDTIQPPHKNAARFYRKVAERLGNKDNFLVTMEWPSLKRPRPIVIETSSYKFRLNHDLSNIGGTSVLLSKPSPRLG